MRTVFTENALRLFVQCKHHRKNERGCMIIDSHHSGSRYDFDLRHCPAPDWQQFDTFQDAPYFGVWVNKKDQLITTYAEGSLTVVFCPDLKSYNSEIKSMCEFYDEAPYMASISFDRETVTKYYQDRQQFFKPEK